jgi:RNA polymerase sigma factor (sigma-70 family)
LADRTRDKSRKKKTSRAEESAAAQAEQPPANALEIAAGDSWLIQRCTTGDEEAWTLLVSRYERFIFSIAMGISNDPEAAADIFQQVCLELYQRLEEIKNLSSLSSWIGTVTRRKSVDYYRAHKPTEALAEEVQAPPESIPSNFDNLRTLRRALAALPERNRQLIEMLYIAPAGYSYEEIASRTGIPVASIGPTRLRSLKKLKKLLS